MYSEDDKINLSLNEKKIKILYTGVILRKDWGGGEPIVALNTIMNLKKIGYEVIPSIYSPRIINSNSKIGLTISNLIGGFRKFISINDEFKPAVSYYQKIIKSEDPDIIISQYDYDTSIVKATKKDNKKIIVYVQIWWPICPKMTLFNFNKEICSGYKYNNCAQCIFNDIKRNKFNILKFFYFKNIIKFYNSQVLKKMNERIKKLNSPNVTIIALSSHMKKLLIKYGINENKIKIIPNGVDLKLFSFNPKYRDKIVVYYGGQNSLKGFDIYFEIARRIKIRYPEVKFYATGSFDDENKVNYVEFMGYLNNEAVIQLLSNARITLFPSIWDEPFGLVIIESMAVGTPVIAFNVGIINEIIDNGENGFLIKPFDIEDMISKILMLLTNDQLFSDMSEKARKKVSEKYSEEYRISTINNLIKDIIVGHKN